MSAQYVDFVKLVQLSASGAIVVCRAIAAVFAVSVVLRLDYSVL